MNSGAPLDGMTRSPSLTSSVYSPVSGGGPTAWHPGTQKSRGFGFVRSTEPPGLSELRFGICWQRLWLWRDPRRVRGPFPATHVSHIASEAAASHAASIALRVQMPGGRETPAPAAGARDRVSHDARPVTMMSQGDVGGLGTEPAGAETQATVTHIWTRGEVPSVSPLNSSAPVPWVRSPPLPLRTGTAFFLPPPRLALRPRLWSRQKSSFEPRHLCPAHRTHDGWI